MSACSTFWGTDTKLLDYKSTSASDFPNRFYFRFLYISFRNNVAMFNTIAKVDKVPIGILFVPMRRYDNFFKF